MSLHCDASDEGLARGSLFAAAMAQFGRWRRERMRRRTERQAMRSLLALDDYLLRDINVTRNEIRHLNGHRD